MLNPPLAATPGPGALDPRCAASPERRRHLRSVVGRVPEIREALRLLRVGRRLVTLTGPPGIGKTRLAAEVADRYARSCGPEPVWCDLRGAVDVVDALRTIYRTLGMSGGGSHAVETADRILDHVELRGECLVVLDNCEAFAADLGIRVARWLDKTDGARFLVTSRHALQARGEAFFELGPLSLGRADEGDPLSSDAAQMFVDRIDALGLGFDPRRAPEIVSEIVARLDGVPLAIELAAAQAAQLGLRGLADDLAGDAPQLGRDSTRVLGGINPLEAAIDRSWGLLTAEEQMALAKLSVFRGGVAVDAARAVIGDAIAPSLAALREKSLVGLNQASARSGELRYELLESIREYGHARLDRETHSVTSGRHAQYFADHAAHWREQAERSAAGLRMLGLEFDNLLQAHRWAHAASVVDPSVGASLAQALHTVLHEAGPAPLHLEVLEQAVDAAWYRAAPQDCRRTVAVALAEAYTCYGRARRALGLLGGASASESTTARSELARGWAHHRLGDQTRARREFESAWRRAERADDPRVAGEASYALGKVAEHCGDLRGALEKATAAYRVFRSLGLRRWQARLLIQLAHLHHQLLNPRSRFDLERARPIVEEFNDRRLRAQATAVRASIHLEYGELARAKRLALRAQRRWSAIGDKTWEALMLGLIGAIEHRAGADRAARALFDAAAERFDSIGERRFVGLFVLLRAGTEAILDEVEEARSSLAQAKTIAIATEDIALAHACRLQGGQIDLALAARDELAGELGRAATRREAVGRLLRAPRSTPEAGGSEFYRIVRRELHRVHAFQTRGDGRVRGVLGDRAWIVALDGSGFREPGGPVVAMHHRPTVARLLAALACQHRDIPRQPLPRQALIAAGWPGEQMRAAAARNRLDFSLTVLRKAGLRELLVSRKPGYVFDPSVSVRLVPTFAAAMEVA